LGDGWTGSQFLSHQVPTASLINPHFATVRSQGGAPPFPGVVANGLPIGRGTPVGEGCNRVNHSGFETSLLRNRKISKILWRKASLPPATKAACVHRADRSRRGAAIVFRG